MHGFKSFANKEVMKLGQGITTVVGPNGCGKTNIVDAIRWVLGEQKYSVLRSGKMEDVIFNGADGIKPLSVCEVSMTVHNNAGKLPIEYNDVEIARRVYRSGESEYYLNKTQCRLKDILDLFVDTGMGTDAYSVIELKMIEQILSESGDDRRKMFEEAAGIHKYRTQRKTTLRKFEATRSDLERIKDIIAEVEQKVNNLSLQLKRFKRHATLTETLESKEMDLAYLQVHRYRSVVAPLQARIKEFRHLRESKTSESSVHEKELIQLQSAYKTQEADLNVIQQKMYEMNKNRELFRNKILVWAEQGRGSLLTIDRLERERGINNLKIDSLKQLTLDFDKEMTDLEPTIEAQLNSYKTEKDAFNKIENTYKTTVQVLDDAQNERWKLQRKLADDRSLFDRTYAIVEDKELSVDKLNVKVSELIDEQKSQVSNEKKLIDNKNKAQSDLQIIKAVLGKTESELQAFQDSRDSISEERHAISAQIKSLKGQQEFYHELVESKEGFPEGTRYVLENPKLFSGVLGTVADMFQVDAKYRDALESGLGDLSHCLIAIDKKAALDTLVIAREYKAGNFTIIPLEEVSKLKTVLKEIPKNELVLGRASDLITTSKLVNPLAEYLLGNLLIVNDLKKSLLSENLNGWGLVDQSGAYSGSDMILKNRQVSEHGNLMGRQKKLNFISNELIKHTNKESDLIGKYENVLKEIQSCQSNLKNNLLEIEKCENISSSIETDIIRFEFRQTQVRDAIQSAKVELKETADLLKQSKHALKSLQPAMDKAQNKLDSFQEKVDKANDDMLIARKNRDEFQQKVQDARIKLIELETRRDQLFFKKTSGDESSNELKNRQNSIKEEIKDLQLQKKKLDTDISSGEKELDILNAEIQKQRSILDLKQSVFRETYQNIEEIQSRIASEQRDREQILEELKNSELEASETNQRIKLIEERIRDRYNKKIATELVVDESEDTVAVEIDKVQRSLENIGPINMAVQGEHDEENERLEILSTQREDLIEAEENLRETIRKIDKVARKRFQETFDLIKKNFEKLFQLFFEGGTATLKMIGDPDPLEADIGIEAQPPGKRNTSLRLLSSGEKALTAISLLFSIYQVKPSPYCILDEVDAPLDDVNIHKFTKVLAKFSDETQFIIVTHNKLTMEIADYMYGVTQEKKGVSQLVSVNFN
ncbi:MAG: chromosome segregation protein SMC [Candidatus Marinimicrobia bacterium]|jgi:chromosome segregation protein|nr:chromosome segregation protein SMC [Candidatus Neomarinimicrobiota bacterium]MBT3501399.1 chromosome segregation protein SMC [Candidatus Neomarinimicrobiota bacterium]MBT3998553.1 chromosome segregation protein SMC [Candidatus Neomarinimicrobiota bacterium]MBT4283025.1 chromosome segregation protein SMC [Candidatus Neomarinimicrobiota bacterium]MBT4579886.1 chromosome segregation protein SMC [Candidatus Neomarinimicrobiota bacterium]